MLVLTVVMGMLLGVPALEATGDSGDAQTEGRWCQFGGDALTDETPPFPEIPARCDLGCFRGLVNTYAESHGIEIPGRRIRNLFDVADANGNGHLGPREREWLTGRMPRFLGRFFQDGGDADPIPWWGPGGRNLPGADCSADQVGRKTTALGNWCEESAGCSGVACCQLMMEVTCIVDEMGRHRWAKSGPSTISGGCHCCEADGGNCSDAPTAPPPEMPVTTTDTLE